MISRDRPPDVPAREEGRSDAKPSARPRPERACPNCGALLMERQGKLICPDRACGYYMSCSDFY